MSVSVCERFEPDHLITGWNDAMFCLSPFFCRCLFQSNLSFPLQSTITQMFGYPQKEKARKCFAFWLFSSDTEDCITLLDTYDDLTSSFVSSDSASTITRLITGTVFLFSAISCLITCTSFFSVVHINLTSDAIRVITIDSVHHVDDFT